MRRLDLDDVRAEKGELRRAIGTGVYLPEVDDANPFERRAHAVRKAAKACALRSYSDRRNEAGHISPREKGIRASDL
jgi:hypothetical protein